jgi:hypothetical protein
MTLNLARADPIFFSNNVIEPLRNRIHHDSLFNSISRGLVPTSEGVASADTLIADLMIIG